MAGNRKEPDEGREARRFAGWVRGDHLGLDIPAEPADLAEGGAAFLTKAFRASGALKAGNAVSGITRFEELAVGGTGRKLILSVTYERPEESLPSELFVKFSRNSDDPARDRLRRHMREEIMLALASRHPGFPVRVPTCMFADFQQESGTGILVTERVLYGKDGVEPCHVKCQDYDLEDPLGHYRTIIGALARLAGNFKAGVFPKEIGRFFPAGSNIFDKYPIPFDHAQAMERIDRIAAFDAAYPALVHSGDDAGAFFDKVRHDMALLIAGEGAIRRWLHEDDRYVSLCHFNANIDNAWFWADADGERHCGLLDWGMVGQMHVALALWGSLSGAEPAIWEHHLDELVNLFVREYKVSGGPELDPWRLETQLRLFAILMGVATLFDAPAYIRREIPMLRADATRFDPEFGRFENARVQLHILNNVLRVWEGFDISRTMKPAVEAF